MAGGPFPDANSEVNDYFDLVTPYLNNNDARLSVSAGNLSTLNTFFDNSTGVPTEDGWSQIWVKYSDPAVVNKTVRDLLKARKNMPKEE